MKSLIYKIQRCQFMGGKIKYLNHPFPNWLQEGVWPLGGNKIGNQKSTPPPKSPLMDRGDIWARYIPIASMKVDLPAPGGPEIPNRKQRRSHSSAFKRSASACWRCSMWFDSTNVSAWPRARRSPACNRAYNSAEVQRNLWPMWTRFLHGRRCMESERT